MDSCEGAATLEWWANRSTSLGSFGVRVTVRVAGSDWACDAILDHPPTGEDREGFDFLRENDPLFRLRFDEGSTVLVDVVAVEDGGRLILTAGPRPCPSPDRRPRQLRKRL
ncbi:hypothetical protein O1Q96_27925 [Streptomyces sp. Qhu-G9]|uniref:hypothetical protein n=1 Tax=Streptomyces sp. Qhu-G9 TaxID=3452799 RepID=UPI0022AC4DA2|nr:hypothetical protein [Streptomyces aurantiacus]WAU83179.1 hypothetical protein O1Q96_27925 [Streptomyces aurantiacus]